MGSYQASQGATADMQFVPSLSSEMGLFWVLFNFKTFKLRNCDCNFFPYYKEP